MPHLEMLCVAATAALLLFPTPVSAGLSKEYFAKNTNSCYSTGLQPQEPVGMDFCLEHSFLSCCLPGFDLQTANSLYQSYMSSGAGCGLSKHSVRAAYSQIRAWACLACDPNEPKYRLLSAIGDEHLGGKVKPSPNSDASDFTWRICKSFLYGTNRSKGMWGSNGTQYDSCGIQVSPCVQSPLFNVSTQNFSSSPSSCVNGAELIVPSVAFLESKDPAAYMLSLMAQTLPGFQFVVVNDLDPAFNWAKTPCFRTSGAAAASVVVSIVLSVVLMALTSFM